MIRLAGSAMRLLRHSTARVVAILTLAGLGIVAHARVYGFFVTDDAFISLRYAERLLAGDGLTWTSYDRVEGYSNLLWVLLCAVPGAVGLDLVAGARLLGWLCTLATCAAFLLVPRKGEALGLLVSALGITMVVVSSPYGVWSVGGLETPLACALLAWGVVGAAHAAETGSRRWLIAASGCLGLLCITRPDGVLCAVVVAAALAANGSWRPGLLVAGVAAFCVLAQLLFRLTYYGEYLPNTVSAKLAFTSTRMEHGFRYVARSLGPLAASWLSIVMLGVLAMRRQVSRLWSTLVLGSAACWTLYVAFAGGDSFPAWRQLMPVVTLGGLAAILVVNVVTRERLERVWEFGGPLLALALVGAYLDPANWAAAERWQWDGRPVGRFLAEHFGGRDPLVGVDAAGAVPFYSKLRALDLLGLCDRYLAHHRPATMGHGRLGHELGDAEYYLKRAPDVLCFGVPPCLSAPQNPATRDLVGRPEFRRHYTLLNFAVREGDRLLVSELWVRRDGALGLEFAPSRVRVPAYFLANAPGVLAESDDGAFVVRPGPAVRAVGVEVSLLPGAWSACFPDSSCPGCGTRVQPHVRGRPSHRIHVGPFGQCVQFSLERNARVELMVGIPRGTVARFRDFELSRNE